MSVSRSIIPIVDDESAAWFGHQAGSSGGDQVGPIEGVLSRFGRSFVDNPERLVEQLRHYVALAAADWLLVTIPNQLGVDFNLRLLEAVSAIVAELEPTPAPSASLGRSAPQPD